MSVLSRFMEQLKVGLGSVRQPAISPLDDPRTGVSFRKGVIVLSAGGAEVSELSQDGEVMKQPTAIIDETRGRVHSLLKVMARDSNPWMFAFGNRDYDEQGALVSYQDDGGFALKGGTYIAQQDKTAGQENHANRYYLGFGGEISITQILGALVVGTGGVTLANGANQNVAIPDALDNLTGYASCIRITGPTAIFSIGGLIGVPFDGQVLFLDNRSGFAMTLNHEDAGSTAANRINSNTGANVACASAILVYDGDISRWRFFGKT